MDTIQSMRKLLSVYSESLKSQTIMESVQTDSDFISIVNEIKDSIMIAKSDLPAHVPMLNPSEIFSMGIDSDMTDEEKEWLRNYSKTCMLNAGDSMAYKSDVKIGRASCRERV